MRVRPAVAADGAAIAAIANPIIRDTAITFTSVEKTPAGIAEQIAAGQPYWVVEIRGEVIGYATISRFVAGPAMPGPVNIRSQSPRRHAARALRGS